MPARTIFTALSVSLFAIITFVLLAWSFPYQTQTQSTIIETSDLTLTQNKPIVFQDAQKLMVDFPLKPNHELYLTHSTNNQTQGTLFLMAPNGDVTQITRLKVLTSFLGPISTKIQALALGKFFTAEPTRFLIEDNPVYGIEPKDAVYPIPPSLNLLLSPASVNMLNETWVIERDLLLYSQTNNLNDAQLVRTQETLLPNNDYILTVKTVLATGETVKNLLPPTW